MNVGDPAESATGRAGSARPGPAPVAPPAARRLATLSAALLGFVLPVLMVVANKSAPASLAAAALAANGAALLAGHGRILAARYRAAAVAPTAVLVAGIVALMAASFAWTIAPQLTARGLVEGLPELLSALGLAAAWPLVARPRDARWLVAGVAAAGLLIVLEHGTGMPLHALARARGEAWDLKRSAVPPLLLLWPAAALLWPARRFAALGLLGLAVAAGVAAAHSGAPAVGLALGAALFGAALVAPRPALGLTGLGLALLVACAPWTGSILSRALPPDARQELREEHAEHRLSIWTAFEHRGFDRPWLGHGFDASFRVAETPRPDGTAPPARQRPHRGLPPARHPAAGLGGARQPRPRRGGPGVGLRRGAARPAPRPGAGGPARAAGVGDDRRPRRPQRLATLVARLHRGRPAVVRPWRAGKGQLTRF